MKGLAYIGALRALEAHGVIQHILEITGSSIGALFGLLVAIGYTSTELTEEWTSIGIDMTKDSNPNPDISIQNLIDQYGFDDGTRIDSLIGYFLSKKGYPPLATFQDLFAATPDRFSCVVSNVNERKPMILSATTTPELRLVDAIHMSMSLPVFFTHGKLSGDIIVDGGITCNLPVDLLFSKKPRDSVLAFYLRGLRMDAPDLSSFESFIGEIMSCLLKQIEDYELEKYNHLGYRVVAMTAGDISTFTANLTKDQILAAIQCGESATLEALGPKAGALSDT